MDISSKEEANIDKGSNIFTSKLLSFYNEFLFIFRILCSRFICLLLRSAVLVSRFIFIERYLSRYGVPGYIYIDNGTQLKV